MKKTILFIAFLILVGSSNVFSQTENTPPPRTIFRNLVTQEVNQWIRAQNWLNQGEQKKIDKYLKEFRTVGPFKPKNIPIVFHILYHNPNERVSKDQVLSQIYALNRDFNHEINTINHPAENLENFNVLRPNRIDINFCLARIKEGNQDLEGIFYEETETIEWSKDDAIKHKKDGGSDGFQPKKFLNVWVGNFGEQISGYAQLPGGPNVTDGIVIDYRFFGIGGTSVAPYDEGKTLTHLVGNYLGLPDLWNEYIDCGDDGIFDTPIHNAPNVGCPTYKHITLCQENQVEMTMNFMDNTDDACMNMFTYGQMKRMHAVLSPKGPRKDLSTTMTGFSCFNEFDLVDNEVEKLLPSEKSSNIFQKPNQILKLSPNPARDLINISVKGFEGEIQITIYSAQGELVSVRQFQGPDLTIDCKGWTSGLYFVNARFNDRQVTHRLVISH